jgi:hypothetical protein
MQPESFMNIRYKFSRRRYGHGKSVKFFTWLEYRVATDPAGEWKTYGDPWPKSRLNKQELNEALHNIVSSTLRVGDRIRINRGSEARVEGHSGYDLIIYVPDFDQVFTIPSTQIAEVL